MTDGLNVRDSGNANVIDIAPTTKFVNCDFTISGSNNSITLGERAVLSGLKIQVLSNGNTIHIGDDCRVTANVIMKLVDGNRLFIGKNSTVGGCNFICGEGAAVRLGEDCMLAWGLEIRTTDSHAIIDSSTGERINFAEDIVVEDHVWIGAHATLLKGTRRQRDSIVSIRAGVTGAVEAPGVILGGPPARVLRKGVTWERPLLG